ncbi:MAG: tRNA (N6-isopentenyl adenosine(37)-C2)-methylthiotransferase MiaB [bacterium]|nr:tRNA (N6-isopentenyl adenosine(37)-C2)-methylthiotransferase MiaB [bacterium]
MGKRFKIFTYGCQMNRYDTETISGHLEEAGYTSCEDAGEADLILLNTCSIRDKAEQKVYSQLGRLKALKEQNPGLKIGVCGCFATREGETIAKRHSAVDLVFGTQNIAKLPALLREEEGGRVVDVQAIAPDFDELAPIRREGGLSAYVSIARGCDNYCTFCVVPYTRGPEWSKPSRLIVEEVERTVEEGFREVMLLGQNVNSYGGKMPGELTFGGLLRRLDRVEGLERVRFMTSHPKDCDEDMIGAMAECDKVCEHLHLPVQSGSDDVLRRMQRGYTAEEYLSNVSLFRALVPGGVLTSDVIVGFPGETDRDFEQTLRVMEEACYDNIYLFKYSPRPGTPAFGMTNLVPDEVTTERFNAAARLQRELSDRLHRALEGTALEVMVEGEVSSRNSTSSACESCPVAPEDVSESRKKYSGRSRGNHRVQFMAAGFSPRPGDCVEVGILRGGVHALDGVSPAGALVMEESES